MFDLIRDHQLNIMMMLGAICFVLAVCIFFIGTIPKRRKLTITMLEFDAGLLVFADRLAYIYRGDETTFGFWMVRITNFLVYFLSAMILFFFNLYMMDLLSDEGRLKQIPVRMHAVSFGAVAAVLMLIVSRFSGWFYVFDEHNRYQRTQGFVLWYLIPFVTTLIELSVMLQYLRRFSRKIIISLLLFAFVPLIASVTQVFTYGLSLTNMAFACMAIVMYILALSDLDHSLEQANTREIQNMQEEQRRLRLIFEQTTDALSSSIDAKDKYTHGHSRRVAEYSVKIAERAGKTAEECNEIYFAALLHDVGKIGVPDFIINKEGKLTPEEYEAVKKHPVVGKQILSSISESPYLAVAAESHHERFDGRGYPIGLKGADIPEIARIIAVADAYDAMTSKRSYRDPLPQNAVREELVKGLETQFDPKFATIMINLIDQDSEYKLRERFNLDEMGCEDVSSSEEGSGVSRGILVSRKFCKIRMHCKAIPGSSEKCIPSLVLFDSADGLPHYTEAGRAFSHYFEYGTIRFDGTVDCTGARKMNVDVVDTRKISAVEREIALRSGVDYEIETVRYKDHARIRIIDDNRSINVIIAMPDCTRYAYVGLTGKNCEISNVRIDQDEESATADDIPRIAEEISYIKVPAGDIPNVEVDSWRTDYSEKIPVKNGLKIQYHSLSLPSANYVWHSSFVVLYSSDNGEIGGENYHEYAMVRTDGECWGEAYDLAYNLVVINKTESFGDWDAWKEANKRGTDCYVTVKIEDNSVYMTTQSAGILTKTTTVFREEMPEKMYIALTGDQCAITNIRIS